VNWRRALVALLLSIPTLAPALPAGKQEAKHWTWGTLDFALSAKDIQASRRGKLLFSAQQRLGGQLAAFRRQVAQQVAALARQPGHDLSWDLPEVEFSGSIEPLSSVGSIVSLHESGYSMCPGCSRPHRWDRVIALDLAPRTGKAKKEGPPRPVTLLELWSERQVLNALVADKVLREFVPAEEVPSSLSAFWKLFRGVKQSGDDVNCDYDLQVGPQLLQSFSFDRIENGQVVVQAWAPARSAACRGQNKRITLILPIPEKYRVALDQAARLQAGYLASGAKDLGDPSFLVSADAPGLVPPEYRSKAVAPRKRFKQIQTGTPDGGPATRPAGAPPAAR
jgi:hypothetical protein